jgi:photosystem II stability/assembly factor-like uncharacterized protein
VIFTLVYSINSGSPNGLFNSNNFRTLRNKLLIFTIHQHKEYKQDMKFIFSLFLTLTVCLTSSLSAQNNDTELYQPLSPSARPVYSDDLPEFVKMTFQANPNFKQIEAAFDAFEQKERAEKAKKRKNTEGGQNQNANLEEEEEDPYEVYFERWKRAYEPYVQGDGSILLPTVSQYKRQIQTANREAQQRVTARSGAANWTNIGPKETNWLKNSNAAQPACPWQANIYAFDIAKSNTSVIYAAPETGGVFKTVDKGLNWTECRPDFDFGGTAEAVEIHPTDPNTVYVGIGSFLWKTTDGGLNWADLVNCTASGVHDIAVSPIDPNIVMITADNGFFRSINAGSTWTRLYTDACYDIELNPTDATHIFILKTNGSVVDFYKSTDSGASFTLKTTGVATLSAGRLAVSAADGNRIYMLCTTSVNPPKLLKSLNEGETWGDMNPLFSTGGISDVAGGQGYYDLTIAASQTDANQLIYGLCTLVKGVSADNGATFTYTITGGYAGAFSIHPDMQEAKTVMNGTNMETWVSTDGGLTLSTDFFTSTANAVARNNGLYATEFWGFSQGWNEDILVGGRYHNGNTAMADFYPAGKALRLGGGEAATGFVLHGQTRSTVFSDISAKILPSTFDATAIDFSYTKTPNEGSRGRAASNLVIHPYYFKQQFVGEGNILWKTTDNGTTFVALRDFGSIVRRFEVCRKNPSVIYLGTDAAFYKSTDGGINWATITPVMASFQGNKMYLAVNPNNEQDVWAVFANVSGVGKVLQSIDGGTNWVNRDGTLLGSLSIGNVAHTGNGIYIAASTGRVFYRNTSATDWTEFSTNLPVSIDILRILPFYRDGKLRVGGSKGAWETPLAESVAPIALPTVDKPSTACPRDTFYFEDYSILKHAGATWSWSFSPTPQYVSNAAARNPKVVFGAIGNYDVSLTVTNANGTSTKTVPNMVTITTDYCALATTPTSTGTFTGTGTSTGSYARASAAPDFGTAQDFTIGFWFKTSTTASDAAMVTDKNWGSGIYNGWVFAMNSGRVWFNIGDDEGHRIDLYSQYGLNDSKWHYVAASVTRTGNAVLYVDGVNKGSTSATALLSINSSYPISIGVDGLYNYPYAGEIDEVKIWNTALTEAALREKMHLNATPTEPNLINYYQFNDATTNEYDRGTNSYNLTFSASASRSTSTAPVGSGTAFTLLVNSAGVKTFTGTDCDIEFAAGTLPNGNIVVSKMDIAPDQLPTATAPLSNKYWIVNNYGTTPFTALTSIKFSNLIGYATGSASNFKLYKRASNAHGATWGTGIDAADVLNSNALTFSTGNNITSFSQFALASDAVLSLNLLSFTAILADNSTVLLNWATEKEENFSHFEIERSFDGKSFETIGNVKSNGKAGEQAYNFMDKDVKTGNNYYRLKMVDSDQKVTFSPIRTISIESRDKLDYTAYPNPTRGILNIRLNVKKEQTTDIMLYDNLGRQVYTYRFMARLGSNQLFFNTHQFPAGLYTLKIKQDNMVAVEKVVLE